MHEIWQIKPPVWHTIDRKVHKCRVWQRRTTYIARCGCCVLLIVVLSWRLCPHTCAWIIILGQMVWPNISDCQFSVFGFVRGCQGMFSLFAWVSLACNCNLTIFDAFMYVGNIEFTLKYIWTNYLSKCNRGDALLGMESSNDNTKRNSTTTTTSKVCMPCLPTTCLCISMMCCTSYSWLKLYKGRT